MATLRCYGSAAIVVRRKICSRTQRGSPMDSSLRSASKQASRSASFTCKVNKPVYQDKTMGILCYTDEKGELVCEGLDEGPRLTWQDMEDLTKERLKTTEDLLERTLQIAGRVDWSSLKSTAATTPATHVD